MPSAPRRPKLPRELFETRSHAWHSLGLGDELAPRLSKRALGGLLVALLVLAATLVVYYNRQSLAPRLRATGCASATVAILVIVGSAATHWLVRGLSPPLYRRLDPATAGTLGFMVRLFAMAAVVILALRIAGVNAAALARRRRLHRDRARPRGAADPRRPLRRHRPAEHPAVPGRRTGAPRRRRPGRLDRGHGQLARPLLRDPGPGGRPPAGPQQRPHQPRRRAAARARQGRRPRPLRLRRQPAAHRGAAARARSPYRPATGRASHSRKSTRTASCCGSTPRRCGPRTARSWPRRFWRRFATSELGPLTVSS